MKKLLVSVMTLSLLMLTACAKDAEEKRDEANKNLTNMAIIEKTLARDWDVFLHDDRYVAVVPDYKIRDNNIDTGLATIQNLLVAYIANANSVLEITSHKEVKWRSRDDKSTAELGRQRAKQYLNDVSRLSAKRAKAVEKRRAELAQLQPVFDEKVHKLVNLEHYIYATFKIRSVAGEVEMNDQPAGVTRSEHLAAAHQGLTEYVVAVQWVLDQSKAYPELKWPFANRQRFMDINQNYLGKMQQLSMKLMELRAQESMQAPNSNYLRHNFVPGGPIPNP